MRLEDLGLVGNCQFSALISRSGSIDWCCLPRFDAEPFFGALLDEEDGGSFRISPPGGEPGEQSYLPNSNVLETYSHVGMIHAAFAASPPWSSVL